MNTNKRIAFLIGAGFSVPAGFPTASMLNSSIQEWINNHVCQSFMEGHGGNGEMLISFIFKFVLSFLGKQTTFNYESFYDALLEETKKTLNSKALHSYIERGMCRFQWQCTDTDYRKVPCNVRQINDMLACIVSEADGDKYREWVESCLKEYQMFIAKSLAIGKNNGKLEVFKPNYTNFINILSSFISKGYEIDIYSLNHDLLLESLFLTSELNHSFCTGFSGEIKSIENKQYQIFNPDSFDKPISLYKLHGSIDTYMMHSMESPRSTVVKMTNGFSVDNAAMDEHNVNDFVPLFLTGKTSKDKHYIDDEPYKTFYKIFKEQLDLSEKLFVIGYSGGDEKINQVVYDIYDNAKPLYIISPDARSHPFVTNVKALAIQKSVTDINQEDFV